MAKAPKIYTRLTRSPVSLFSYKSLWLAADHIMQVDSSGYRESYQRFQFTDIQGFFIRDSSRRLYWNLFWGVLVLIFGLVFIGSLINDDVGVSVIFLAITSVLLIWNNALGPSCQVYLVTRVQTTIVGSLVRQRKARKVLGRLQPLIEAAQSGLVMPATAAASSGDTGAAKADAGDVSALGATDSMPPPPAAPSSPSSLP
jgi:hypothetical protein